MKQTGHPIGSDNLETSGIPRVWLGYPDALGGQPDFGPFFAEPESERGDSVHFPM